MLIQSDNHRPTQSDGRTLRVEPWEKQTRTYFGVGDL